MKFIISANQHNEIYSEKCGVLVSGKVSDEINYLVEKVKNLENENAKLKEQIKNIWKEAEDFYLDD